MAFVVSFALVGHVMSKRSTTVAFRSCIRGTVWSGTIPHMRRAALRAEGGREYCPSVSRKQTAAPRMADIREGDSAPSFSELPTSGGGNISSENLDPLYVIYFYPKDSTSGCTVEASDFTSLLEEFHTAGSKVLGVSRDSVESHDAFVKEVGIGFPLLADVTGEVSDAYGVYKLRQMFGKEFMGIERSTFIVKDGTVVKAWRGIKAQGHAAEVLEAIKAL